MVVAARRMVDNGHMAATEQAQGQKEQASPWAMDAQTARPSSAVSPPAQTTMGGAETAGARDSGAQAAAAATMAHWAEPGSAASSDACAGAARQVVPFPPLRSADDKAQKPEAASTPTGFQTDGQGRIFTTGECPVEVGFRDAAGHSYMAVDASGKQHGLPLEYAHLGTLRAGGAQHNILRMEQVTLKPDGHAPPASTAAPGEPAAAKAMSRVVATYSGKVAGLLDSGEEVVERTGQSYAPVAVEKLPAALRTQLGDSSRIDLSDGKLWVYMSFALADEKTSTGRWVPPGHGKDEVAASQASVRAEADKLPAESQVRQEVDGMLRVMGLVSTVEGSFDSRSGAEDNYASLGIFQWAMPKDKTGDTGSMGVFFSRLKERATAAEKRAEKERTAEDKLYLAAWQQCTQHGLDVKGSQILLNGAPATGGAIESGLLAEMGKGALRTYQLVAARDWVSQFRETVVRPGPSSGAWIGNGYSEQNKDGTQVALKLGSRRLQVQAASHATVGELFSSEQSLAYAVMLGVNRPHYVEASLWKAISTESSPQARCQELLTQLEAVLAKAAGKSGKRSQEYKPEDIVAAGEEAIAIYQQLQSLIWPSAVGLSEDALAKVPGDFKRSAMQLYSPSDARYYHRERRFSTVDAAF